MQVVGNCPDCGAPIWAEQPDGVTTPLNHFTCLCRLTKAMPVYTPAPHVCRWETSAGCPICGSVHPDVVRPTTTCGPDMQVYTYGKTAYVSMTADVLKATLRS